MKPTKSSRRHESLIPLSREHHYALMLCLQIRRERPPEDNAAWARDKARQVAHFFATDLTPHFRAEEEVLFPAMRGLAGAPELLERLLSEHRMMAAMVASLEKTGAAELDAALADFADLLEAHIRREERELFPIYETLMSGEAAAVVARAVKDIIGDALQPGEASY